MRKEKVGMSLSTNHGRRKNSSLNSRKFIINGNTKLLCKWILIVAIPMNNLKENSTSTAIKQLSHWRQGEKLVENKASKPLENKRKQAMDLQNVCFVFTWAFACSLKQRNYLLFIQSLRVSLPFNYFASLSKKILLILQSRLMRIITVGLLKWESFDWMYLHGQIIGLLLTPYLKTWKMTILDGKSICLLEVFNNWLHVHLLINWEANGKNIEKISTKKESRNST